MVNGSNVYAAWEPDFAASVAVPPQIEAALGTSRDVRERHHAKSGRSPRGPVHSAPKNVSCSIIWLDWPHWMLIRGKRRRCNGIGCKSQGFVARPVPAAGLRLRRADESRQPRAASLACRPGAENLQVPALCSPAGLHRPAAHGQDWRLSQMMVSAPGLE